MSIRTPTEIQAACIPHLLAGKALLICVFSMDCIGNAKTGSGKTIAFALPILQKLSADPYGLFALILTPTRELAFQISEQFAVLGAPLNVRTAVVVGGMDMIAQAIELNNRPHIIIATPGRLVDHMRSSSAEWDLSRVRFLVLDEADRLLTQSFADDLAHLFVALPSDRQTALFTATWTSSIDAVADAPPRPGRQKPYIHKVTERTETVEALKQLYILVPSHVREVYLFYLLTHVPAEIAHMRRAVPETKKKGTVSKRKEKPKPKPKRAHDVEQELEQPPPTVIFCARARTAAFITSFLQTLGVRATALHSRLTQRDRLMSLQLFRSNVVPVLVSTDVGARGLDIEGVALVVNWDLPGEPEEYTHRVGRTARAGRSGMAVSFVCERDEDKVHRIEDRIHVRLEELSLPEESVLEHLSRVGTAKRQAAMASACIDGFGAKAEYFWTQDIHDSSFGKREAIHREKRRIVKGKA
ncbi:DEAD-domain-containing protein [Vararia minispora EC-137]|uniref:DEAD-domain-containing protein n=1 Tax=Vararia minispora EC-137 TaxID=1314806 RepID=A0ACB8QYI6_9AGAM|nr:DEAD-domain-containing protein [Vararia minispora EC-137]